MSKVVQYLEYLRFCFLLVFTIKYSSISATINPSLKNHSQQIVINAFAGCNIRVINFRGLNIDFKVVKEPILLLRYLSHCETDNLYPYELGSVYSVLRKQNSSTCLNANTENVKLPPKQVAISYVAQTLSDSFHLSSKNKNCEANVYFHPQTEQTSPQMYSKHRHWGSALKHPILINYQITLKVFYWKPEYLSTVPLVSLLICNSTPDSICVNENDVNKWLAGISYDSFYFSRLSVSVLIWKYPSLSLKTLCPYCDPCDSFTTITIGLNIIPTSRNELQSILQESQQINPDPHSVRLVLQEPLINYGSLTESENRNQKGVLEHIQKFSIEKSSVSLYIFAEIHLISLLLPKLANVTFAEDHGETFFAWENVIVDACSPTKLISSHSVFRPMIYYKGSWSRNLFQDGRLITNEYHYRIVSCHKERVHWTYQLQELISPFDISTWSLILTICIFGSWIVQVSTKSHIQLRNSSLLKLTFSM